MLTDRDSKRNALFLVIILVVIVLIISFFVAGVNGIFSVIKFFLTAILIVGFIGFVFYVVYYIFFKKHRKDVPYQNWQTYLRSARDNGADMMEDLVLTGDSKHSSKRFMTIKGYLQILAFDGQAYDMFIGKRASWNFLEDYKIVMLRPSEHTDLIGDVYVKGISLIQKYGYYFLNTEMHNYNAIDKTVASDTFRTMMYETLGDMKGLLDRATGLDAEWAKDRANQKLLKIPTLSGQQNNNEQK